MFLSLFLEKHYIDFATLDHLLLKLVFVDGYYMLHIIIFISFVDRVLLLVSIDLTSMVCMDIANHKVLSIGLQSRLIL